MLIQLLLGTLMIGLTVVFHALALDFIIRKVGWLEDGLKQMRSLRKALSLSIIVLSVFAVLVAEMWAWCGLFYGVGAFPNMEQALYYSVSSFTTVGYGDLVAAEEWRLPGGIESANGLFLFGWSAAFIFEITTTLYRREAKKIEL